MKQSAREEYNENRPKKRWKIEEFERIPQYTKGCHWFHHKILVEGKFNPNNADRRMVHRNCPHE